MLKGLDPLLGEDLLYVLAAMGHGDQLALVDRNFPAASMSRRLVRLAGADLVTAARAILSVLPLDTFVDRPVIRMEVVGAPSEVPQVQAEILALCQETEGRELEMGSLKREDFYAIAKEAFAVVATGEPRPYGCVLFTKGVLID
ncbi:MAG TPA: RbsD/FucU domain-containing protein [Acidimicrobiales bacterium]|nr:RbsD/FucU domain-containing protein [Acidimicrobiales bacterium]